jgi:hypothetical protein
MASYGHARAAKISRELFFERHSRKRRWRFDDLSLAKSERRGDAFGARRFDLGPQDG